jgi:hypothetical protein
VTAVAIVEGYMDKPIVCPICEKEIRREPGDEDRVGFCICQPCDLALERELTGLREELMACR